MGLLDRLAPRRTDPAISGLPSVAVDEPLFATKALRKLLASLVASQTRTLIDLGPVVGSNVAFLGESRGCKIFVMDLYAELERHARTGAMGDFASFLAGHLSQPDASVDGVICWDFFDYLDRPSAQALADQLTRVLRPDGTLFAFFGSGQASDTYYTKYVIADEVNLKHRPYPASRPRQANLANRDIIRLFSGLRVSDSFLMKNNVREILFRKPSYETS